jgi:hypothetical protein
MSVRTTPLAEVTPLPVPAARYRTRSIPVVVGRRTLSRTITQTNQIVQTAVSSITGGATGSSSLVRRRAHEPAGATDDWGRDPGLVSGLMLLTNLRWDVATGGDQHLPTRAGALIVVNSLRTVPNPFFTALAISDAIDRPVRFVGHADGDLFGALRRRVGGLLDHPDEVAGALRAKQIVVMSCGPAAGRRRVGAVDHTLVAAAIATGTRVFPAAVSSTPFARRARLEIGPATRLSRKRRGPLAELELADRLQIDVAKLLQAAHGDAPDTPREQSTLGAIGERQ